MYDFLLVINTNWRELKSTKNRLVFVSRGVLNIFRISATELSGIGRSEHAENRKQPLVIQN